MKQGLFIAATFFALGWWLHRPPPAPEPASAPACEPVPCAPPEPKPFPAKKRITLAPPLPPKAPSLPEDAEKLKTCFVGEAYKGSGFVLHLATGNQGQVTRVRLVGDDFMSVPERECVRDQVKGWKLGQNLEPDLVVRVVL